MNELINETKKRSVAYKLRVGDLLKAKPIVSEGRFIFAELGDKKILRVNIIANVVDKYFNDGEKKYSSLTVDDASGQIKLKSFGEDIEKTRELSQGDTIQIVGLLREYNGEIYILPEICKKIEPRWLLVRKLEIQNSRKNIPLLSNAPLRDLLLEKIKNSENNGGIEIESMIMNTEASPNLINAEIKKLLEDGTIYEPRPGVLRYLG